MQQLIRAENKVKSPKKVRIKVTSIRLQDEA